MSFLKKLSSLFIIVQYSAVFGQVRADTNVCSSKQCSGNKTQIVHLDLEIEIPSSNNNEHSKTNKSYGISGSYAIESDHKILQQGTLSGNNDLTEEKKPEDQQLKEETTEGTRAQITEDKLKQTPKYNTRYADESNTNFSFVDSTPIFNNNDANVKIKDDIRNMPVDERNTTDNCLGQVKKDSNCTISNEQDFSRDKTLNSTNVSRKNKTILNSLSVNVNKTNLNTVHTNVTETLPERYLGQEDEILTNIDAMNENEHPPIAQARSLTLAKENKRLLTFNSNDNGSAPISIPEQKNETETTKGSKKELEITLTNDQMYQNVSEEMTTPTLTVETITTNTPTVETKKALENHTRVIEITENNSTSMNENGSEPIVNLEQDNQTKQIEMPNEIYTLEPTGAKVIENQNDTVKTLSELDKLPIVNVTDKTVLTSTTVPISVFATRMIENSTEENDKIKSKLQEKSPNSTRPPINQNETYQAIETLPQEHDVIKTTKLPTQMNETEPNLNKTKVNETQGTAMGSEDTTITETTFRTSINDVKITSNSSNGSKINPTVVSKPENYTYPNSQVDNVNKTISTSNSTSEIEVTTQGNRTEQPKMFNELAFEIIKPKIQEEPASTGHSGRTNELDLITNATKPLNQSVISLPLKNEPELKLTLNQNNEIQLNTKSNATDSKQGYEKEPTAIQPRENKSNEAEISAQTHIQNNEQEAKIKKPSEDNPLNDQISRNNSTTFENDETPVGKSIRESITEPIETSTQETEILKNTSSSSKITAQPIGIKLETHKLETIPESTSPQDGERHLPTGLKDNDRVHTDETLRIETPKNDITVLPTLLPLEKNKFELSKTPTNENDKGNLGNVTQSQGLATIINNTHYQNQSNVPTEVQIKNATDLHKPMSSNFKMTYTENQIDNFLNDSIIKQVHEFEPENSKRENETRDSAKQIKTHPNRTIITENENETRGTKTQEIKSKPVEITTNVNDTTLVRTSEEGKEQSPTMTVPLGNGASLTKTQIQENISQYTAIPEMEISSTVTSQLPPEQGIKKQFNLVSNKENELSSTKVSTKPLQKQSYEPINEITVNNNTYVVGNLTHKIQNEPVSIMNTKNVSDPEETESKLLAKEFIKILRQQKTEQLDEHDRGIVEKANETTPNTISMQQKLSFLNEIMKNKTNLNQRKVLKRKQEESAPKNFMKSINNLKLNQTFINFNETKSPSSWKTTDTPKVLNKESTPERINTFLEKKLVTNETQNNQIGGTPPIPPNLSKGDQLKPIKYSKPVSTPERRKINKKRHGMKQKSDSSKKPTSNSKHNSGNDEPHEIKHQLAYLNSMIDKIKNLNKTALRKHNISSILGLNISSKGIKSKRRKDSFNKYSNIEKTKIVNKSSDTKNHSGRKHIQQFNEYDSNTNHSQTMNVNKDSRAKERTIEFLRDLKLKTEEKEKINKSFRSNTKGNEKHPAKPATKKIPRTKKKSQNNKNKQNEEMKPDKKPKLLTYETTMNVSNLKGHTSVLKPDSVNSQINQAMQPTISKESLDNLKKTNQKPHIDSLETTGKEKLTTNSFAEKLERNKGLRESHNAFEANKTTENEDNDLEIISHDIPKIQDNEMKKIETRGGASFGKFNSSKMLKAKLVDQISSSVIKGLLDERDKLVTKGVNDKRLGNARMQHAAMSLVKAQEAELQKLALLIPSADQVVDLVLQGVLNHALLRQQGLTTIQQVKKAINFTVQQYIKMIVDSGNK